MIFNEISLKEQMPEEMEKKFSDFLKICQELKHKNNDKDFYYTDELMTEKILGKYTIHDWLADINVSQKEKQFLRTLLQRGHRIDTESLLESELLIEIDDEKTISSKGGLMAYEWDSYLVSILSSDIWKDELIEGKYLSCEEDEKNVLVRNCGKSDHIEKMIASERNKQRLLISSGIELWEKRQELYPHLVFCDSVKKQLIEARVSIQIQTIMKRIQILEDYFSSYEGEFNKDQVGFGCRSESETVKKDQGLNSYRKFRTPYGKEEYFYWHIGFSGNYPGRIHFIPDAEHKVGIVGYIGKHLPTSQFSTI